MLLVTGGAGFIGSNVVAGLNEAGRTDIVVNDVLGTDGKWRNLGQAPARRRGAARPTCSRWLDGRKLDAVIHLGAISDTTATDADLVMETNFRLSLRLLDWCTATPHAVHLCLVGRDLWRRRAGLRRRLVAARRCKQLRPMNLYGWSKHLFDLRRGRALREEGEAAAAMGRAEILQRVRPERVPQGRDDEPASPSVFDDAKAGRTVRLFKSHRPGIADGDQRRDFIYVDDAVAVVRWLLETPPVSGIFNVGTGKARSFRDLIAAMFRALGPRAEHRIHRHAGEHPRPVPVFHASRGRQPAPRRLQCRLHAARRRRRRAT